MGEMTKMSKDEKQAWAVSELCKKQAETGRLPHKDDFDAVTLSRIKAFLGPWPRALEKAGLKEAKPDVKKKKKRTVQRAVSSKSEVQKSVK